MTLYRFLKIVKKQKKKPRRKTSGVRLMSELLSAPHDKLGWTIVLDTNPALYLSRRGFAEKAFPLLLYVHRRSICHRVWAWLDHFSPKGMHKESFQHTVYTFLTPPKIIRYLLLYHNMLKNANLIKKGCLLESISPKTALKIVQILFIFLFNFLNFIIMIIYYI